MTEITKVLPAHIIRLYAWDVLQHNTGMTVVNGLIPVIALEDEPQISDAQVTYLIYGYAENNDPALYEIKRGIVTFRVKARRFGELGQITNALTRAFENCDISAQQVNQWARKQTAYGDAFKDIRFTSMEVIYVEGGSPEETEGGPTHGLLNVAYECIINDHTFVLPADARGTMWD